MSYNTASLLIGEHTFLYFLVMPVFEQLVEPFSALANGLIMIMEAILQVQKSMCSYDLTSDDGGSQVCKGKTQFSISLL